MSEQRNVMPLRVRWSFARAWLDAGPWLRPAPDGERCYMGAPIGYPCRRRAVGDGLWCAKHDPATGSDT